MGKDKGLLRRYVVSVIVSWMILGAGVLIVAGLIRMAGETTT